MIVDTQRWFCKQFVEELCIVSVYLNANTSQI